jgi:ribokinase
MSGKILVVGSLNMDLVVNSPRHPQIGETILGGKFATFPGGKGANQAVAAARMGASVSMIGRVGKDGFGADLLRVAEQDGIDISHISLDEREATGIALITVDSQGRNTIVVASGANLALLPEHVQAASEAFTRADVLVAQLENPLDTVSEAILLAAQHGLQVVLNPAPAQPLPAKLLAKVDYFIPNEGEAMQISGTESLEAAIPKLLDMGVRNLMITLGEQGVLVVKQDSRQHIPAYPVQAVDTVAAGDAFVGAFAAGLAEGMALEQAVCLGNAAAAISVTRPGAQPSLPFRSEVDEFLGDNT